MGGGGRLNARPAGRPRKFRSTGLARVYTVTFYDQFAIRTRIFEVRQPAAAGVRDTFVLLVAIVRPHGARRKTQLTRPQLTTKVANCTELLLEPGQNLSRNV